jgi:hypothetical protein
MPFMKALNQPLSPKESRHARFALYLILVLSAAIVLRISVLRPNFVENDEMVYTTLTQQLDSGHGYTLHGSALLDRNDVPKAEYDRPVFFHPPVSIFFFLLCGRVFKPFLHGLELAQLISFVTFFLAMISIAGELGFLDVLSLKLSFPLLVAFTPIYAHTNTKIWIDNPRLAFFVLALFFALRTRRTGKRSDIAALIIFSLASTMSKGDALFYLVIMLGWVWLLDRRRDLLKVFVPVFILNFSAFFCWTIYADALHPGRPVHQLIKENYFIRSVTTDVTSLQFIADYFGATPTLLPALFVLVAAVIFGGKEKGPGAGLAFWVFSSLALYTLLGILGYSRIPRYLLLSIPASLLLFAYAIKISAMIRQTGHVALAYFAEGILYLACAIEVAEGISLLVLAPDAPTFFPFKMLEYWIQR